MFHWYLTKIEIKAAFLQSGAVERDLYVKPPRECSKSVVHIPQLFYLRKDGNLKLIIAKVTDAILVGGPENCRYLFIDQIWQRYKL